MYEVCEGDGACGIGWVFGDFGELVRIKGK